MTHFERLMACLAAALLLAGCTSHDHSQSTSATPALSATTAGAVASSTAPPGGASAAARAVVERFGTQMQKLSVLAPRPAIRDELPAVYGDLLSPELLADWQAHPDRSIGREGSSPWPDRIEIKKVDCAVEDNCHVSGDVEYVTSNEVAHGGVFMRRAITLELADTAHGWRITAVHLATVRQ